MANTSLAVVGSRHVPKGSKLERSEYELAEAMANEFESFYKQGVILDRIRTEREYKDAGYESFEKYCNKRQPCGIKKSQAYALIKAKDVRPLLPNINSTTSGIGWTEKSVAPLLHKDFKPADQKRLGKKIEARVKKGETLTSTLVKTICDEDRGVQRIKKEKHRKQLSVADTPGKVIQKLRVDVNLWRTSLAELPASFWDDAESEDPGCLKTAIAAISELVSFLRS
jgi:hypothetical protein